jgi:ribonucleoside-diphosphate reductase alpha chain
MPLKRFYTQAHHDPYQGAKFRTFSSEEWQEYTVPSHWGQVVAEMAVQKIFYHGVLPTLTCAVPEAGVPEWLWRRKADDGALDVFSTEGGAADKSYKTEKDIRNVLNRMAGVLTYQAWTEKIITREEDAVIFYDELRYILLHQIAAPEIRQWAVLGVAWAYGVTVTAAYIPHHRIAAFRNGLSQIATGASLSIPLDSPVKNIFKRIRILGEMLALESQDQKVTVTLPIENIDSPAFMAWKRNTDIQTISEDLGHRLLRQVFYHVMDACNRDSVFGFDPARNPQLKTAVLDARAAGLPDAAIRMAIRYAEQGQEEVSLTPPVDDLGAEQLITTVISMPDSFIESALTGHEFLMSEGGVDKRHVAAQKLWDSLAEAVWSSGEPAVSFRDSISDANPLRSTDMNTLQNDDENTLSACGGFVFLANSEAPAATLNLLKFFKTKAATPEKIDTDALAHVAGIMTLALDASLSGEATDKNLSTAAISAVTRHYRPLLLGMTNLSAFLMGMGIAYDSDAGRTTAALLAALISGSAYQTSARMADTAGCFAAYPKIEKSYLQGIQDKLNAFAGTTFVHKGVTRRNAQIRTGCCSDKTLVEAVKNIWMEAHRLGRAHGFRNAHLTAIDTEEDVQALLAVQTPDIMPETSLVRFEGYFSDTLEATQLYGKKWNPMVPRALAALGYSIAETENIHFYAVGHGTLFDAPVINHHSLRKKGFPQAALDAIEVALRTALHIRYAFNKWTLGHEFCEHVLGFSPDEQSSGSFDMLSALGFSEDDIETANLYCCGTMTLEGAPHLKPEHLKIFDCIAPCATGAVRHISPEAQIKMQAAIEPFLSGAAVHTVIVRHHTSIEDIQKLILLGWELGLKNIRIYRDNCSLLHPVALLLEKQKEPAAPSHEGFAPPARLKAVSS